MLKLREIMSRSDGNTQGHNIQIIIGGYLWYILNSDCYGLNLVGCSLIEFTFHTVMSYALNVLRQVVSLVLQVVLCAWRVVSLERVAIGPARFAHKSSVFLYFRQFLVCLEGGVSGESSHWSSQNLHTNLVRAVLYLPGGRDALAVYIICTHIPLVSQIVT